MEHRFRSDLLRQFSSLRQSRQDSVQTTFRGTSVAWCGLKNSDLGKADVYVDDILVANVIGCYSKTRGPELLFTKGGLPNTTHMVKVVLTGVKNQASAGTYLVHDHSLYYVDP